MNSSRGSEVSQRVSAKVRSQSCAGVAIGQKGKLTDILTVETCGDRVRCIPQSWALDAQVRSHSDVEGPPAPTFEDQPADVLPFEAKGAKVRNKWS